MDVYILTLLLATFFVGPLAGSINAADSELQHLGQNRDIQTQGSYQQNTVVMPTYNIGHVFVLDLTLGWFLDFEISFTRDPWNIKFPRYLLLIALFSVVSVISDAPHATAFGTSSIKFCVLTIIPVALLLQSIFWSKHYLLAVAGYFFEAVVASMHKKIPIFRGLKAIGSTNQSLGLLLRQWPH